MEGETSVRAPCEELQKEEDLNARINALHGALADQISGLEKSKDLQRCTNAEYIKNHARIRHLQSMAETHQMEALEKLGCDFGKLYDIKTVFDRVTPGRIARVGMKEKDFLHIVAPVLCPTYPVAVSSWYNTVDNDGAGVVDWPKLSNYIIRTFSARIEGARFKEVVMEYDEVPRGYLAHPTGYRVTRAVQHASAGVFYGLGNDENIRSFSYGTLKPITIIHHADGNQVCDMKFLAEKNQLWVAQSNGFVFIYDTVGECTRTGNIAKGFRVGAIVRGEPIPVTRKTVQFDPLRMMLPTSTFDPKMKYVEVSVELSRLGTTFTSSGSRLEFSHSLLGSIEPIVSEISPKDPCFFAGFSEGHISLYRPELLPTAISRPVVAWRPHTSWVTKLKLCTAHQALNGIVSSSADGTIVLTDVEKYDTSLRLVDQQGEMFNAPKPITSFDISMKEPLIVSCGHQRGINIWSALQRGRVACLVDHKASVIDVYFNDELMQCVSLGHDKTIRVWDLRTMKCCQVITDKERRFADDPFSALNVDTATGNVIAWAGTPFVFAAHDVEEKNTASLGPAIFCAFNRDINEVVVSDSRTIRGWKATTGELTFDFKSTDPIKAVVGDTKFSKFFIVSDSGKIFKVLYGSSIAARTFTAHVKIKCIEHSPETTELPELLLIGSENGVLYYFSFPEENPTMLVKTGVVLTLHLYSTVNLIPGKQAGDVISVVATTYNRIIAGLSSGEVVFVGLTSSGPAPTFVWTPPSTGPPKFLSQQTAMKHRPKTTEHLWSRCVEATRKERALCSAGFTKFRFAAQQQTKQQCEVLLLCDDSVVFALLGSGEGRCWRHTGKTTEMLCAFPATSIPGASGVVGYSSGRLFVGDDCGVLSVFNFVLPTLAQLASEHTSATVEFSLIFAIKFSKSVAALTPLSGAKLAMSFEGWRAAMSVFDVLSQSFVVGSQVGAWEEISVQIASTSFNQHRFGVVHPEKTPAHLRQPLKVITPRQVALEHPFNSDDEEGVSPSHEKKQTVVDIWREISGKAGSPVPSKKDKIDEKVNNSAFERTLGSLQLGSPRNPKKTTIATAEQKLQLLMRRCPDVSNFSQASAGRPQSAMMPSATATALASWKKDKAARTAAGEEPTLWYRHLKLNEAEHL